MDVRICQYCHCQFLIPIKQGEELWVGLGTGNLNPNYPLFTFNFHLFRVARESGRFSVTASGGVSCHISLVTP